jgi:hypothetical protein
VRALPLGRSCIVLLCAVIAARVSAMFLPCETWSPAGYVCAGPYLKLPSGRSHTWVANWAIPEGARRSTMREFLTYRKERFTLDENGYRNGPGIRADRPQAILFGTSFSLGLALNDEDTFVAHINQQLGPLVYNAAATFVPNLYADTFIRVARARGFNRGVILLEVPNRGSIGYAPPDGSSARLARAPERLLRAATPFLAAQRRLMEPPAIMRVSALFNMLVHNDRILPNPNRDDYSIERLLDGRRMLVLAIEKHLATQPDPASMTAGVLERLRDELAASGYRLAVILQPTGYSVYVPMLVDPGPDGAQGYFRDVSTHLSAAGIANLNLLPVMREAAKDAFRQGRLIYFPDDPHWNAEGCAAAARVAAPWISSLLANSPNTPEHALQ